VQIEDLCKLSKTQSLLLIIMSHLGYAFMSACLGVAAHPGILYAANGIYMDYSLCEVRTAPLLPQRVTVLIRKELAPN